MNKYLYTKLGNVLKAEANYVSEHVDDLEDKFSQLSTIMNLLNIIENYDELEPMLKAYFSKKGIEEERDRNI